MAKVHRVPSVAPSNAQVAFIQNMLHKVGKGAIPSVVPLAELGGLLPGDVFRAKFPGASFGAAIQHGVALSALKSFRSRRGCPMIADATIPFVPVKPEAKRTETNKAVAVLAKLGL